MIYLVISILFTVLVNIQQRLAGQALTNPIAVNMAMRLASGLVAMVVLSRQIADGKLTAISQWVLAWSIAGGVVYWLAGLACIRAFGTGHLGISAIILRCSTIISTTASLIFWNEVPLGLTSKSMWIVLAAIALMLIAIFSCGIDQIRSSSLKGIVLDKVWILWLTMAFIFQGLWEVTLRASGAFPTEDERHLYLTLVFIVSMILGCSHLAITRIRPTRKDLIHGSLMGIVAMIASGTRPFAIRDLSGVIVFPMTALATMVLLNLASVFIWKAHLGKWGVVGLVTAVASAILLSMR